MSLALISFPLAMALLTMVLGPRARPWLIPLTGAVHFALTIACVFFLDDVAFAGWLLLDRLGRVVLLQTSAIYFLCSIYAPGYLALHPERNNRGFCAALLVLIAIISLHIQSHHLGLMWVALESLTLV